MLVVVLPFALPRDEVPAWVEIAPMDESAFEEEPLEDVESEPAPVLAVEKGPAPEPRAEGVTILASRNSPTEPSTRKKLQSVPGIQAVEAPVLRRQAPPLGAPPTAGIPAREAPSPTPASAGMTQRTSQPKQAAVAPRLPKAAPHKAKVQGPLLVEYLNAFCPHCRKTLKRLEDLLEETQAPVRKRRVYTWSSNDYPIWARACAYAQSVGCEEEMFRELLKARSQSRKEVFAAARRAGLDTRALALAVNAKDVPARLQRDRNIVQRARLRMLPTIDIGRRRLQGEQSSSELREALEAAVRAHGRSTP